jgi:hypothetical protein
MNTGSEQYKLNSFGKCCEKLGTCCGIIGQYVILPIILFICIIAIVGIVLLAFGGIGINIYNAIHHISPYGSYDHNQKKKIFAVLGNISITLLALFGYVIIMILCSKYGKNLKTWCVPICRSILYTKISDNDNAQEVQQSNPINVITATEMV